ncbi:unnamed protein product [Penicillium olsonii]|uniref:Nucleoside phosphorylase domain-containing protein n=1 Tax=Penicillium olsonii TaxID=99116 RepID=A0A9W4HKL9_PENOL|nr:unnamed protein product [Penicillium olsonii]CAG8206168.1 unnamed protein product [Penicillium olsonii]
MPSNQSTRSGDPKDYEIAIFCALGLEADATIAMFDETWEHADQPLRAPGDTNSYTFGQIWQHPVVLVHLPRMGKVSACQASANLRSSFPHVRLGLFVGVCGSVPSSGTQDVFLGDVIISTQIVQLDFGRLYQHGFARKDSLEDNLGRPNPEMSGCLTKLQGQNARAEIKNSMCAGLATVFESTTFALSNRPATNQDRLFDANYGHKHADPKACISSECTWSGNSVCDDARSLSCSELGCDLGRVVPRIRRQRDQPYSTSSDDPDIHFGRVGSGDQVIKSALHRDCIAKEEGVIGFEMEGAGIWETVPTIIVKGVSDYSDSHKSKAWQPYSAAAAAACAKGMLKMWRAPKRTERRHA